MFAKLPAVTPVIPALVKVFSSIVPQLPLAAASFIKCRSLNKNSLSVP